jgi:hypothetical protein
MKPVTRQLTRLLAALALACAGCSPQPRCGGALYFDPQNVSCRPCPKDATFRDGTCECSGGRVFQDHRCALPDGATPEPPPDAGAANSCSAYCDFIRDCLADNALAAGALPEVISALHADDAAACRSSCADASASPLGACIEAGSHTAACAGDGTQTGLRNAITLLADCSRAHADDPLRSIICNGLRQSPLVASQLDFCD